MAMYSDVATAQADGVLHYFNFDESTLTFTDLVDGWSGSVLVEDIADRSAASVTGSDVFVPAELDKGFDTGANIPASPANPDYEYLTQGQLPIKAGAPNLGLWTIRFRFFYRGKTADQGSNATYLAHVASKIRFYFATGSDLSVRSPVGNDMPLSPSVSLNVWHEVVLTYDGSVITLYLDGASVSTLSQTSTLNLQNGDTFIGGVNTGAASLDNQADCIIDEFSIWDRHVSSSEVTDLWNGGEAQSLILTHIAVDLDSTLPITVGMTVESDIPDVLLDTLFPISVASTAFQDWTAFLDPLQLQEIYLLTVTGSENGVPDLTVPISSWQATNQAGGKSSYLQAVIPGAGGVIDAVNARSDGQLIIQKGYRFDDGSEKLQEILRSNFDSLRYDRGPRSYTLTVSGYRSGQEVQSDVRTLTGVRSISLTNGKHRVRCDVDLFLQPGMDVIAADVSFQADFINYYVNQFDKFCEVGES